MTPSWFWFGHLLSSFSMEEKCRGYTDVARSLGRGTKNVPFYQLLRKVFYRNGLMQELFLHVFPGFCCICCHCWTQLEGITDHCSVMNKSSFQLVCARANCSCLSVPHRCRERISSVLMAFQSGHVYLYMNCKHLTIACSASFKAEYVLCCTI